MQDIRCFSQRIVKSVFNTILGPTIRNSLLGLNFLGYLNPWCPVLNYKISEQDKLLIRPFEGRFGFFPKFEEIDVPLSALFSCFLSFEFKIH